MYVLITLVTIATYFRMTLLSLWVSFFLEDIEVLECNRHLMIRIEVLKRTLLGLLIFTIFFVTIYFIFLNAAQDRK